jgi:hypothetical protein
MCLTLHARVASIYERRVLGLGGRAGSLGGERGVRLHFQFGCEVFL